MACGVTEERLWSWIDRQAPELGPHLAGCPECRSKAADFREGIEAVTAAVAAPRRPPRRIGTYEIVGILGEGGQGVVYEARQQRLERPVALKVVRGGCFHDEQDVRLFEREIHTLALLKHPAIAAIYEAGAADDGVHFFAMELVPGVPITTYAAQGDIGLTERLRLFHTVCEAIQYAHQRGVIHRDLKPGHILVDADGAPKILDFGLARVRGPDGPGAPPADITTGVGRIQGTLPYMSPEQAQGRSDEIDVRTDVYALGVILYQLLTGALPYDVSNVGPHEAARVISEQPPRRPGAVRRDLPGDVETIILKALEKEPGRRYQGAAALADDIRRYLTGQPILARPPRVAYQLRKLIARHKLSSGLILLSLALALAAGIGGPLLYARGKASETRKALLVNTFLQDMLASFDPTRTEGRPVDIYLVLAETAKRIETDLKMDPEVEAAARTALGNTYLGLGRYEEATPHLWRAMGIYQRLYVRDHLNLAASLHNLARLLFAKGDYVSARRMFEEALDMRRRLLGPEHADVAVTLNDLAMLLHTLGDVEAAESFYGRALAMDRRLLPADHPDTASTLHNLAVLLRDQGKLDAAKDLFDEALKMRRRVLGAEHTYVAATIDQLARLHHLRGDFSEAERFYREAMAMRRKVLGDEHPDVALSLVNLGRLLEDQGDAAAAEEHLQEALRLRRELLGVGHPATLDAMETLAALLRRQNDPAEARRLYEEDVQTRRRTLEVLDAGRRVLPDRGQGLVRAMMDLAAVCMDMDDAAAAEPLLDECVRLCRGSLPAADPLTREALTALGRCRLELGRADLAEPVLVDALRRAAIVPDADAECDEIMALLVQAVSSRTPSSTGSEGPVAALGDIAARLRGEDALPAARIVQAHALNAARLQFDADDARLIDPIQALADTLRALGRPAEATPLLAEAVELRRRAIPPDPLALAASLMTLGSNLMERGDAGDAVETLNECLALRTSALGEDHWLTANAASVLGEYLLAERRTAEAEPHMLRGYAGLAAALGPDHPRTRDGLNRLIVLYEATNRPELAAAYRAKVEAAPLAEAGDAP